MRSFKRSFSVLAMFALLLGSARVGMAQGTPPPVLVQTLTGNTGVDGITTETCNKNTTTPPGLCQPATAPSSPSPAPRNNGGAGPSPDQNLRATITICETAGYVLTDPEVNPVGDCFIKYFDACGAILNTVQGVTRLGGGTLTATGTGRGFRFGKTYISLIYKNGNTATCSRFPPGVMPTQANTINPMGPNAPDNDFASMMLGVWVVNPDGTATLNVRKQATLTGLNNYASVSVREVQPPHASFTLANDPAPQLNALRACGPLMVATATGPDGCPIDYTPPPIAQ